MSRCSLIIESTSLFLAIIPLLWRIVRENKVSSFVFFRLVVCWWSTSAIVPAAISGVLDYLIIAGVEKTLKCQRQPESIATWSPELIVMTIGVRGGKKLWRDSSATRLFRVVLMWDVVQNGQLLEWDL